MGFLTVQINCSDVTSEHTLYDDLAFSINRNDKEKNIRVVIILNQLLMNGIKKISQFLFKFY